MYSQALNVVVFFSNGPHVYTVAQFAEASEHVTIESFEADPAMSFSHDGQFGNCQRFTGI